MKIHTDGTVEGSPAECAEYLRLKGSAPVDMGSVKFVPPNTWQPRPWPVGDAPPFRIDSGGTTAVPEWHRWQIWNGNIPTS